MLFNYFLVFPLASAYHAKTAAQIPIETRWPPLPSAVQRMRSGRLIRFTLKKGNAARWTQPIASITGSETEVVARVESVLWGPLVQI